MDKPQPTVLAWWIWAGTFAGAIVLVLWLSGCALQECPDFEVRIYETEEGRLYVLDEENFLNLIQQHNGLAAGNCAPSRLKGAI